MRKGIVARSITGLLLACAMLVFTGCFTLLGLLLSEDDPVESKPTEQTDDDSYVLEGSEGYQEIMSKIKAGVGNSPSFQIDDDSLRSLEIEVSSVSYDVEFQLDYSGLYRYKHSNVETNVREQYLLEIWTFDVAEGKVQVDLGNVGYSDEIKQYVKEVFDTVQDEAALHRGAITCVFRPHFEAGDFLARGTLSFRFSSGKAAPEGDRDIYSCTFSGLEYLPAFTTVTEIGPDVEVVSKYKTFMVHPGHFKKRFDVGPDGWKDTYEEGYNPFLRTWDSAETGYNEYGLYDVVDSWKNLELFGVPGDTYAMSLKLKSKGDGFYVTEGGWKVYSTNRQNAKALDDAWNSSSKTVSSYGLCYSMGLVPAGENKYELVLYARTRT